MKSVYTRKTRDVWHVVTNYGYGWETECTEYTLKDAKQTKREYMENAQGLQGIKIVKKREKIEG